MTRPITIEQPAGSLLRTCVDQAEAIKSRPEDLRNDDPYIRALTAHAILEQEPRLWLLPVEVVRDAVVIPTLAALYGRAAAASLHPDLALEFALLRQALAKVSATASERLEPVRPHRNAALVDGIIMAAWIKLRREWLSDRAAYAATAEVLGPGIKLKVVRDAVKRFLKRQSGKQPEEVGAAIIAIHKLSGDVVFELPARYSLEKYTGRRKPAPKQKG